MQANQFKATPSNQESTRTCPCIDGLPRHPPRVPLSSNSKLYSRPPPPDADVVVSIGIWHAKHCPAPAARRPRELCPYARATSTATEPAERACLAPPSVSFPLKAAAVPRLVDLLLGAKAVARARQREPLAASKHGQRGCAKVHAAPRRQCHSGRCVG